MTITPIILIHLSTALTALILGGVVLFIKKGTPQHRLLGKIWVTLMITTALVSFGIQTSGHFSWIHGLSIYTLISITVALIAIRQGRMADHRRWMIGTYVGLSIAFLFTLLPGRFMGKMVRQLLTY